MSQSLDDLFARLPAGLEGWSKTAAFERYTPESLYTYIDGGAELFISYSFRDMISFKYQREGEEDLVIDLFDMGTAADAFGVFSQSREQTDPRFGQGGEYNSGLLNFWLDRYYVSIMGYPENQQKKEMIFKLADAFKQLIGREGVLPTILSFLPEEGLQPESIRYFHHYVWQNSLFFVSNDNILGIDSDTQCVLARYRRGEESCVLLLARYSNEEKAESGAESFCGEYLGGAGASVAKRESSRFSGCRRQGDLLAVVLDGSSEEIALKLLQEAGKDPAREEI